MVVVALAACGSKSKRTALDAGDAASTRPDQGGEARELAIETAITATDVGVDTSVENQDVALSPGDVGEKDAQAKDAQARIDGLGLDSVADAAFVDAYRTDDGPELDGAAPAGGQDCTGISPSSATFSAEVGLTSLPVSFTIPNYGATAVSSIGADITGSDQGTFMIAGNTCVGALLPAQTCQVSVVFNAPTTPEARIGVLNISGGGAKCAIPLLGQAVLPPDQNLDGGAVDTSRALDSLGPG